VSLDCCLFGGYPCSVICYLAVCALGANDAFSSMRIAIANMCWFACTTREPCQDYTTFLYRYRPCRKSTAETAFPV